MGSPPPSTVSGATDSATGFAPFRARGLRARLLRSHMAVAAIGLALLGLILLFTVYQRTLTARLAEVEAPMAEASLSVLEGLGRTLADLRGWVLIGDENFKTSRRQTWSEQIDPKMARLIELTRQDESSEQQSVAQVKILLSELKEVQWWIEDVARTPGNEPARNLLMSHLRPATDEIYESVTALIDLEKLADESSRPISLMAAMADFRGFFTRSQATLGNLVQSGGVEDAYEQAFRAQIGVAGQRLSDLAGNSAGLSPQQREILDRVEKQFSRILAIVDEIIALQKGPKWNVARFLLREEAVPKSREATALLTALAERSSQRLAKEAALLERLSNRAIGLSGLFFIGMAAAAWFVSRRGASRLMGPIEKLSDATHKMAAGELDEDIPLVSNDELGDLTNSFNRMRSSIAGAEQALKSREEESRRVIESSPSGMIMTDQQGIIVMLNQRAAVLFGYTKEELLGEPIEILVPDSVRGHHHELRDSYMKKPAVRAMGAGRDLFGQRKDGSQIPIEIGLNPIETEMGLRVLTGIIDLTERKRAEEELRLLSNRLVLATSAGGIGVWDYDIVNNSLVWDDQMYRLYGISPERFSGAYEAWEEGLHPDDLEGEREKLQMAIRGERDFDTEFRVVWPDDGSVHFINANGSVLRNEDGEAVQMIGTNWDITARRQAAEELRVAKEAAEQGSRAKSEFLANMSHEIRTPMNGIIGMAELLSGTKLTKDQREYLNLVTHSADSLLTVINDILDFSKIEAGKLELDAHEFDLRDSIGDTLHTLGFRATEKSLELAYQVQSNVPDCLIGDLGRLRQLIVNLVGNALKFTAEGEIVIDVQLESQTRDQASLHFLVKDTGIGIPPEKQKTIFESFTQAESSTTRTFGGTGLGLTISRQLVELMKGRMWVESEPGHGSTFHFTALFGLGDEESQAGRATPETLNELPVLVVDDNDTNRRILMEMLANWEMSPIAASGGAEALEKLERASQSGAPIRLILLDVMMPEIDGFEVARNIKKRYGKEAPKILILSSAGQPSSQTKLEKLGIERALTKPVKQSDLLDAITRLFGAATRDDLDAGAEILKRPDDVAPMRVLLAEDGRVNQMVAIKLLEGRGHSVVVANNGQEAVELFAREDFDAILMDVQMPELDGYEATGKIREREEGTDSHIPIIAMTANAMKGDRELCLESGMDDYVSKPVRTLELFSVLEKYASADSEIDLTGRKDTDKRPSETDSQSIKDIFDSETFRSNLKDVDLMRQLIEAFPEESAEMLTRAREALDSEDAESLHSAAHGLKGLIGNYAAARAFKLTANLDKWARKSDLKKAGPLVKQCEREVARLGEALTAFAETLEV